MGAISAVAVTIWLVVYGFVYANVFAAAPPSASAVKAVAVLGFVAAALILLDLLLPLVVARRQPPQ